MKVSTAAEEVISFSNEGAVEQEFGAVINAKTFFALSSGLYKNKIGTIVREISSNAYDSHVQAKKVDVPFEIHIPNSFEPFFHVKDTGVGLNQDDIEGPIDSRDGKRRNGILTTLFKSTKDQSNDELGGWGLGFKSFYSYTNSASITAIKDGVKYDYSAYLNEKGIPACLLLQKEETTEPNGVTVTIPVQREHFSAFRREIQDQLRFFPVKPTTINGDIEWSTKFDAGDSNLLVDTTNVRIRDTRKDNSYHSDDYFAILGVVGYPIELDNIRSSKRFNREIVNFMNSVEGRIALLFNIGEIEVTVSREGLSYTDKTINSIIDKIELARKETLVRITQEVDISGTSWEKACKANSYGALTRMFLHTGLKIDGTEDVGDFYAFNASKAQVGAISATGTQLIDWKLTDYKLTDAETFRRDCLDIGYVEADSKKIFFVQDTTKKPIARVKEYYLENRHNKVHVFHRGTNEWTDVEIAELSRALGGVVITRTSTLPEPKYKNNGKEYSTAARGGYKIPKAYRLNSSYFTTMIGKRVDEPYAEKIYDDIEDMAPAIYVGGERGVVDNSTMYKVGKETWSTLDLLSRISRYYNATNLTFPEIYLFNKRHLSSVQEVGGWESIHDFIERNVEIIKNKADAILKIRIADKITRVVEGYMKEHYLEKFIEPKYFDRLEKNAGSYPIRLYKIVQKRYRNEDDIRRKLMNIFDQLFVSTDDEMVVVSKIAQKIENAQTLLPFITYMPHKSYYDTDETIAPWVEHTLNYINSLGK